MELKAAPPNSSEGSVTGRTRLSIGAQVVTAVALAFAAAVLVTWLAARPGLRARFDLTARRLNTLDPALVELFEKADERIGIDLFFAPADPPLHNVTFEVQRRVQELMGVVRNQFPSKVRFFDHSMGDLASAQARMRELEVSEPNVVVVSLGEKRAVLRLLQDLARVRPGNAALRQEPEMEAFLGDSALANAILRVSIGQSPKVWFTTGHGERDLYDVDGVTQLGRLHSALSADGFVAERWESQTSPHIPDDVRVVAVMDARQAFDTDELGALDAFVARGGRLLVAATNDDDALRAKNGVEQLVARYGVRVGQGLVAWPLPNAFGEFVQGRRECATIIIRGNSLDSTHPITEPLWRGERGVVTPNQRPLSRNEQTAPPNSATVDLLRSPWTSWRDLPDSRGQHDYVHDPAREGDAGSIPVAIAVNFRPSKPRATDPEAAERQRSRLLVVGGADLFSNGALDLNRDFVLNAFNWLAEREDRLRIAPRAEDRREIREPAALKTVAYSAMFGLPIACAVLGLLLAWRRRT